MPRIGKRGKRIKEQYFDYDVMYTKGTGFWILLPSVYSDVLDSLADSTKQKHNVHQIPARGYNKNLGMGVMGDSEEQVQDNFRAIMEIMIDASLERRKVILVWYKKKKKDSSEMFSFSDYDAVGYQLRFAYANEVKSLTENKPNYYAQDYTGRKIHVSDWASDKSIVIEDTTENRTAIEELYNATILLTNKLDILADPKKLQLAIDSRQKLIN